MTTVHVRANQTTVDWAEGAEFVCERTPFVDNLIQHGGLTELGLALSAADVAALGAEQLDALNSRVDPERPFVQWKGDSQSEGNVRSEGNGMVRPVAVSDGDSPAEVRRRAELALDQAQKKSAAAQENLNETRADSADTLAELNTELDNEPPKTTRSRRKAT